MTRCDVANYSTLTRDQLEWCLIFDNPLVRLFNQITTPFEWLTLGALVLAGVWATARMATGNERWRVSQARYSEVVEFALKHAVALPPGSNLVELDAMLKAARRGELDKQELLERFCEIASHRRRKHKRTLVLATAIALLIVIGLSLPSSLWASI